jgi:hypothetical protein
MVPGALIATGHPLQAVPLSDGHHSSKVHLAHRVSLFANCVLHTRERSSMETESCVLRGACGALSGWISPMPGFRGTGSSP